MAAQSLPPVAFHDTTLYAITIDGTPHVALRPIVQALGLDWAAQFTRIKRHPVLSTCVAVTTTQLPSDSQAREIFTLPLDKLNGWLFGVSVNRVKPELRPKLIEYQRECFDVLARHFMPAQRPHNPALDYDRISPAQAQDLKEIVAAIVKAGVQTYGETWARLQKKFRVNSYLELPATQHLEARAYLLAKLPKASANTTEPPAPAIDPVAALMHQRLLVSFAPGSGRMQCTVLQPNDFVSNWQDMARGIASSDWLLSNAELANMLAACSQRMAKRLGQPAALAA